jgi:thiol-disulfide isomerase/thioredoxin
LNEVPIKKRGENMRKTAALIMIIVLSLAFLSADEKQVVQRTRELFKAEKYEEALKTIEDGINDSGETRNLLSWKYYILIEMKNYDLALETALKKEETSEKKSPWDSMDIALASIKLEKIEKAMDWLEIAVDRGFIGYNMLMEDEAFKPILENERIKNLVSLIKDRIGIGQPVKDFSVTLLSGETFNLSDLKGKVILIDFWATWCAPCRAEIPNLKKYYEEFKDKGFEIIGISLDQTREALDNYMSQENLKWKISFSGQGWEDETGRLYNVNSIPSYWLVGKQGLLRHFGLRGEELRKAVAELIAE